MEVIRGLSFVLALLFIPGLGRAGSTVDTTRSAQILGLRLHQGFVLIHSRDLAPVRNSYPIGVELDWAWHKVSRAAWESCHCYPKLGVSTSFWHFDNPEVLGFGIANMFYIEPVFGAWNNLSFSIRAGFGISYKNRPYDATYNPLNFSYSTNFAFPLQLGGSAHLRLHSRWYLDVTAVYNHISNGGIREPNKGINWPTMALGVGRYLHRPEFFHHEKKHWRADQTPDTRFDITFFTAFKEPESKLYLFSPGVELKYSRQMAHINALTAGMEWMYDRATPYRLEEPGESVDAHKAGVAVGHEFLLGKFLFSQQIGFYLHQPHRDNDAFYQRYGLVYRATPRLSGGIAIKAHRHVADFLDFRVGVSF
jgi:hypothetical protein